MMIRLEGFRNDHDEHLAHQNDGATAMQIRSVLFRPILVSGSPASVSLRYQGRGGRAAGTGGIFCVSRTACTTCQPEQRHREWYKNRNPPHDAGQLQQGTLDKSTARLDFASLLLGDASSTNLPTVPLRRIYSIGAVSKGALTKEY